MIGNRIQRARKASGMSLRDLGEKLTLSHSGIKKYEDNEVTPSSDILIKLAKALNVKVEYFFRPLHFTLENIQYRLHAEMPQSHLDEITAIILDQIEQRIELENLFPSSPIELYSLNSKKIFSYDDIEKVANLIRKQWNLGLEPITDLIDIFEKRGIKVFEINNPQYPKFDGLSARINEIPIIVIGNQWSGNRQRFTLAHELGHLALYGFFTPLLDEEKCCNRFAGAFLLPKEALISILGDHRNALEIRELTLIKEEFGISISSILHRAQDIGIISNSLYLQLRSEYNKRGWSIKEPGDQLPKVRSHIYEQLIFHALAEEYIGESKAAEYMNMSLESFRSLRAMENPDATHHK